MVYLVADGATWMMYGDGMVWGWTPVPTSVGSIDIQLQHWILSGLKPCAVWETARNMHTATSQPRALSLQVIMALVLIQISNHKFLFFSLPFGV